MTYWALNVVFLVPVAVLVIAGLIVRRTPRWPAVALTAAVVLVMTAIFDNVMISVGLVAYNPAAISGAFVGVAPLEDFAYAVAAVVGLPALWVLLGGVFFGAVTDFGALYASVKNDGKSMGMLIEKYIGKLGRKLFLLFCWLFCLIVIAAFADMVAGTFNAYTVVDGVTQLADAAQTNGAAGMVSIMFMVFAVVFGLVQKKLNLSGWKEAVLGILCIVASFAVGMNCPLIFGKETWSYITFVYIFFAAVLPMWLL